MSAINRSNAHWRQRKLTTEQVQEIRQLYAAGGITTRSLGEKYGVSAQLISLIVNGKQRKEA